VSRLLERERQALVARSRTAGARKDFVAKLLSSPQQRRALALAFGAVYATSPTLRPGWRELSAVLAPGVAQQIASHNARLYALRWLRAFDDRTSADVSRARFAQFSLAASMRTEGTRSGSARGKRSAR
jgi:hypothetical protein